jgi:hypothetical protein
MNPLGTGLPYSSLSRCRVCLLRVIINGHPGPLISWSFAWTPPDFTFEPSINHQYHIASEAVY